MNSTIIKYPHAQIRIETEESLESTAKSLSQKLFGGIPFGGKEAGLFEEVPGVRLLGDFLGMFVGLHGFDGAYTLLLRSKTLLSPGQKAEEVDISEYIAELVRAIGFVCVVPK